METNTTAVSLTARSQVKVCTSTLKEISTKEGSKRVRSQGTERWCSPTGICTKAHGKPGSSTVMGSTDGSREASTRDNSGWTVEREEERSLMVMD